MLKNKVTHMKYVRNSKKLRNNILILLNDIFKKKQSVPSLNNKFSCKIFQLLKSFFSL